MIAGLLILSFLLSLLIAALAGILGMSFCGAVGVYIGCGSLSGLGLGLFAVVASRRSAPDAPSQLNSPARRKSRSRYPRRPPADP